MCRVFKEISLVSLLLIATLIEASPVRAAESYIPVKRRVLAPWSSKVSGDFQANPVVRHIETALNHLGVMVDYYDIDAKSAPLAITSESPDPGEALPSPLDPNFSSRYLGVLSCFPEESMPGAKVWAAWLERYSAVGLPWVSLCHTGLFNALNETELKNLFGKFGVALGPLGRVPMRFLAKKNESFDLGYGFERVSPPFPTEFSPFAIPAGSGAKVALTLEGAVKAAAVFTSPRFSAGYGDYGLYILSSSDVFRRQWTIDPFQFFTQAFGIDASVPVPEVAVASGRRIFFSHLDGDGFNSVSRAEPGRYCGEVMSKNIIEAFPTLPFGVSYIVDEIDPAHEGNPRILAEAKRIAALPNVELASHTYYHPLDWEEGRLSYGGLTTKFDSERETVGAVKALRTLVAGAKPLEMVYWSGNCVPMARDLANAKAGSLLNMNGGDSRFDNQFPSIAFVAPLGRPVGRGNFQVFSGNSNENTYTESWTGPYFGYRDVTETFRRTGAPRILKPVNPYFHFFSAERIPGLEAAKAAVEWGDKNPLSPVFPSVYAKSVLAYRSAEILRRSKDQFQFRGAVNLRTLRIDSAKGLSPEMKSAKGLLGYSRKGPTLFLHLDGKGEGEFKLSPKADALPRLTEVGGVVEGWQRGKSLKIQLSAFSRGPLLLDGYPAKKSLKVRGAAAGTAVSDSNGRVEIALLPPSANITEVEVE